MGKSGSYRPIWGERLNDRSSRVDPEVPTLEGRAGVRAKGRLRFAGNLAVHPGLRPPTRGNARALLGCLDVGPPLVAMGSEVPRAAEGLRVAWIGPQGNARHGLRFLRFDWFRSRVHRHLQK